MPTSFPCGNPQVLERHVRTRNALALHRFAAVLHLPGPNWRRSSAGFGHRGRHRAPGHQDERTMSFHATNLSYHSGFNGRSWRFGLYSLGEKGLTLFLEHRLHLRQDSQIRSLPLMLHARLSYSASPHSVHASHVRSDVALHGVISRLPKGH